MSTDLAFLRLHAFGRLWAIGRLAPQQSAPWVPDAPSPSTDGPPMMRCISAWSARRSFINASTPTGLAPCPRFSASQSFSSPTTRPRSPLTRPRSATAFRSRTERTGWFSPAARMQTERDMPDCAARAAISARSSGVTHTSILLPRGRVPRPRLVSSVMPVCPLSRQRRCASQSRMPSSRRRVRGSVEPVRACAYRYNTHLAVKAHCELMRVSAIGARLVVRSQNFAFHRISSRIVAFDCIETRLIAQDRPQRPEKIGTKRKGAF